MEVKIMVRNKSPCFYYNSYYNSNYHKIFL
nr:MAG TPA: hypothetical protein [Bacteriophage sp.]